MRTSVRTPQLPIDATVRNTNLSRSAIKCSVPRKGRLQNPQPALSSPAAVVVADALESTIGVRPFERGDLSSRPVTVGWQ